MNPTTSSCRRCCVREKEARRPAHGDDSLSRWLATERKVGARCPVHGGGALNAGIRAEGADDKLAHALHPSRLAPFAQADLLPSTNRPQHRCETRNEPAGQANIERLRETGLRDRRRNGIAGNGVHRPAAGSQDGFAHWNSPEQFARQGHAPGFTRTARKLSSRAGACGGRAIPQRGRTPEFASRPGAQGQQGTKKRRSEERRPSPHNYGRKPDPP